MSFFIKNIELFFIGSWQVLLLLILLLGESYLGLYFIGGLASLLLFFSGYLRWENVKKNRLIIFLWLVFLVFLGLSGIKSINFPLSLESWLKYVLSFLVFWFFLLTDQKKISSKMILDGLLLIVIILSIISFIFQFISPYIGELPGMNLIYATYGHNHLAALLLLLIPFSWWNIEKYSRIYNSRWWVIVPVFLTTNLLISFGRVAISLGLAQFLILTFTLKSKNKYFLFSKKILGTLYLLIIIFGIIFSFTNLSCSIPFKEKQFCKSLFSDSRPKYWRRALEVWKDNFWLGSGTGTFSLSSQKYQLHAEDNTAYAHNAFLQEFSNLGLLGGGAFAALMVGLLISALKNISWLKSDSWEKYVGIGLVSIYVDVLFDFDWDFLGILLITFVLLALLIRENAVFSEKINIFSKFFQNIVKYFYILFSLFLISIGILYGFTDYLLRKKLASKAFDLFPYFRWHRKAYGKKDRLNFNQRMRFFQIYSAYPDIYVDYFEEYKDIDDRELSYLYKQKLVTLRPLLRFSYDLVEENIDQQNWNQALNEAQETIVLWNKIEEKTDQIVDYQKKVLLLRQLKTITQAFLSEENISQAQKSSQLIYQLWKYQMEQDVEGGLKWDLAEVLVGVANKSIFLNAEHTIESYQRAQDMQFNILNSMMWWELSDSSEVPIEQLRIYLEYELKRDEVSDKDLELSLELIRRYLELEEYQKAEEFSLLVNDWDTLGYQKRLNFVNYLQKNYEETMIIATMMSRIIADDYWLMFRPAKLAYQLGDYNMARELYGECLEKYDSFYGEEHSDCSRGLIDMASK